MTATDTPTDHASLALAILAGMERLGLRRRDVAAALGVHPVSLSRQLAAVPVEARALTPADLEILVGVFSRLSGRPEAEVRRLMSAELPPSKAVLGFMRRAMRFERVRADKPQLRGQRHCFTPAEIGYATEIGYASNPPRAGGRVLTALGRRVLDHYATVEAG